ncbi:low affinity iron permease family protein [Mesorhizobium sp. B2-2-2]|nr:low affinity iron permease family protein [Mesorhizobium sp. B2-2-2]
MTILTFLVFLIKNTQNRDRAAIQGKLDELIRSVVAKNAFIDIEHLTQAEVESSARFARGRRRTNKQRRKKASSGSG